ncbi:hypothetical protein Zmor_000177 [Zophobas morio]|uniref:RNA helicase n=1 Tax=Zophobas morio TaxID=2755281 RepID=A0AA38J0X5_9CUCU|nr:hypothetical protein Zmor_000177 [Zophobas morio]
MSDAAVPQWKKDLIARLRSQNKRTAHAEQQLFGPSHRTLPPPSAAVAVGSEACECGGTMVQRGDKSDSDEDLHYGPGIVSKLKERYLSLAQREKPRPSILRKAASLENLLDDGPAESGRLFQASQNKRVPSRYAQKGPELKRARSVETISTPEETDTKPKRESMHEEMLIKGSLIIPEKPPENEHKYRVNRPKRIAPVMNEKEKPPADVVKQAKMIFERRPEQRTKPPQQTGEVAAKVQTYKRIIVENKPPKKPAIKVKPVLDKPKTNGIRAKNKHGDREASKSPDIPPRARSPEKKVEVLRPKSPEDVPPSPKSPRSPELKLSSDVPSPKSTSLPSPIPDISRVDFKPEENGVKATSLSETPDLIITSSPLPVVDSPSFRISATENFIKEEIRPSIPEELKTYSNIEDDEFMRIRPDQLKPYRIVVTTLVLVGRFTGPYHPDCIFIDEAAQASEPETDIAVALLDKGKQLVLAGDPKQLGPMAIKSAEKFGLGISLLQRLMTDCDIYQLNRRTGNYDSDFITMLRLNFRSHPDILSIPNELFYHGLLQPKSKEAKRDPIVTAAIYPTIKNKSQLVKGSAVEFCSVSSKEKREGSSPSYFNLFEIKMVVEYVKALHNLKLGPAYKVRADQIGVVTPYKRQVYKIKEALKHCGFADVEVGTTESFQGREKRIIIISTVRAQHSLLLHDRKYNLGFVKHDQRFNVAVTRAISKLVVIGCPPVLRTDNKWTKYMDLCSEHGTYFGNRFMADNQQFREEVIHRTRRFKHVDDQFNHE